MITAPSLGENGLTRLGTREEKRRLKAVNWVDSDQMNAGEDSLSRSSVVMCKLGGKFLPLSCFRLMQWRSYWVYPSCKRADFAQKISPKWSTNTVSFFLLSSFSYVHSQNSCNLHGETPSLSLRSNERQKFIRTCSKKLEGYTPRGPKLGTGKRFVNLPTSRYCTRG